MSTINVAFTNQSGDDVGWRADVKQGELVYMPARSPNERYAARVSTNERADTGNMRSYID